MKSKILWFISGFAVGISALSLGHAALPKKTAKVVKPQPRESMLSEIKSGKVTAPELDQDYNDLSNTERGYAENWDQQQKLRGATVAGGNHTGSRNQIARTNTQQDNRRANTRLDTRTSARRKHSNRKIRK